MNSQLMLAILLYFAVFPNFASGGELKPLRPSDIVVIRGKTTSGSAGCPAGAFKFDVEVLPDGSERNIPLDRSYVVPDGASPEAPRALVITDFEYHFIPTNGVVRATILANGNTILASTGRDISAHHVGSEHLTQGPVVQSGVALCVRPGTSIQDNGLYTLQGFLTAYR